MSVHLLKDGRWIVQYRDPVNKNKYKREYFGRGKDAEAEARERDAALEFRGYVKRTSGPAISPLFQDLVTGYLAARTGSMEKTTYKVLIYKLQATLLPEFGKTPANKITKERIDQYVIKRQAQGRQNSTIHREITDIQAILNWAVGRSLIQRNPLSGYKKPRPDPEIISPPTLSEMKEIDKHAAPHLRRALKIIFYTGARAGNEIVSLKWSSVNWNQDTIRIVSARKKGPRYRDVPLLKEFKTMLRKWHMQDKKQTDLNIINYKGKAVKSIQTSWKHAREKAKITRPIIPYLYRHAFVSMLLDAGADLKAISEIVGHSNPNLTLRVYQHTNKLMHKNAIQKLPKMNW